MHILTPELINEIETQDRATQSEWLFLELSDEFKGCWQVDGLWPEYFFELEPIIGSYRLVTPVRLDEFMTFAQGLGYRIVFVEDPVSIIGTYEKLSKDPPVSLVSSLPNTRQGMLPWQIVGFNKLIADEEIKGGYVVWETGSGKTAFIASAIKYHETIGHPFDVAMVVVKSHNKIDMQRKLLRLAGIDSIVIDGTIQKRYDIYEDIQERLQNKSRVVAVTNYEKFREDADVFATLFKKRQCLFFWDEMPTKLSNPETQLYRAIKRSLYVSFVSNPRPTWMRHWALTATPIENSPGDVWSCVNILWPKLLGTQKEFENTYVAVHNFISEKPQAWKNLDRLEAKLAFMTHRVSKDDPDVADMFPTVIPKPRIIDWNPKQRTIYDKLTGKAKDLIEELEDANILAMIQIMQMVCDAPSMIKKSAENREQFQELLRQFGDGDEESLPLRGPKGSDVALTLLSALNPKSLTDVGHTKLEMWREIICDKHPDSKIVTHSTWAEYIFPVWRFWLDKWGVSYVVYTGTSKQKQAALDTFRQDPSIRVFLSGDAGADSIDIAEASVGVNYNIPWKWTTLNQREGRRDRVDSTFDRIYTYSLMMSNSIDERKLAICERKRSYHTAVFDGQATDEAFTASLSREDLIYLITGFIPD